MKTTRTFFILFAGTLLSCEAIFPAIDNPEYCTNENPEICPADTTCDVAQHACVPIRNTCKDSSSCMSTTAAACPVETHICTPCTADNECKAWSTTHNTTINYGSCRTATPQGQQTPGRTCVECWPKNVLGSTETEVKCTADPLKPACDIDATGQGTGLCRPCKLDAECETGICRKAGDYPASSPLQTGQCVAPTQIVYVNNYNGATTSACSDGADAMGTPDKPFCTIQKAVSMGKGPYISVAPSSAHYGSVNVTSGSFIVNGPGRDVNPSAQIQQITVNGGTITLLGMQIVGTGNVNDTAVSCSGASSSVYLFNSMVNTDSRAIDASANCGQLTIDRTLVSCKGQPKFGALVGSDTGTPTSYRIVNSGFSGCGNSMGVMEPYTIKLNGGASGVFAFNTVTGAYRAMYCGSSTQRILNSIVVAMQSDTGCDYTNSGSITDFSLFDKTALPRLTLMSYDAVVDRGIDPGLQPAIITDVDGKMRPMGSQYDVGMQEIR